MAKTTEKLRNPMKTQDNRIDYMSSFKTEAYELMNNIRKDYIALDDTLRKIAEETTIDASAIRVLSISRTNLEASLQYAIKFICITHED